MTGETRDISGLARAVRRLDSSATLRAFAAPGAVLAAWIAALFAVAEVFAYGYFEAGLVASAVLSALLAFTSPALAVLYDAFARQPWRAVSGGIALAVGGAGHVYLGALPVALGVLALCLPFDPQLREEAVRLLPGEPLWLTGPFLLAALGGVAALAVWGVRRTVQIETALASPVPRALLLGDLGGAGFWTRLAYVSGVPSSLWRREALGRPELWLFLLARALVYAVALPASIVIGELQRLEYLGVRPLLVLAVVAGLALLAGGHVVYAAAKRLAARRIWAPAAPEGRRPILFLRSFENDQLDFRPSKYDLIGRWLALWSFRRNADEMLIDEFAGDGEVIALGQPGEARTPFGAARRYVEHDDWKKVVRAAASEASAIVVVAGETPGLAWEYKLIETAGHLEKTIFLFPPAAPDDERAGHALGLFRRCFPDLAFEPPIDKTLVALSAGPDGVRLAVADEPGPSATLVALRQFMQARETAAEVRVGDGPMSLGALIAGPVGAAIGFLIGLSVAGSY